MWPGEREPGVQGERVHLVEREPTDGVGLEVDGIAERLVHLDHHRGVRPVGRRDEPVLTDDTGRAVYRTDLLRRFAQRALEWRLAQVERPTGARPGPSLVG